MLSTPFICCSNAVATDCSTFKAFAPVKVALTCTIGGVIFGYCSVGNPNIDIKPTMTITMAITIATIGRLTKKLPIFNYRFLYCFVQLLSKPDLPSYRVSLFVSLHKQLSLRYLNLHQQARRNLW